MTVQAELCTHEGYSAVRWTKGIFRVPRPSNCHICQFARFLLRIGYNPVRVVRVHRGGQQVFLDRTLEDWGGETTVENDRKSVHITKYVPYKGEE